MFAFDEIKDKAHAHMRAINHCVKAYQDFKYGDGWRKISNRYRVPKHILIVECRRYAERKNMPWPPREVSPAYERVLTPKPPLPFRKTLKLYDIESHAKHSLRARYYWQRYAAGMDMYHVCSEVGCKPKIMRIVLREYAMRNGKEFPIPGINGFQIRRAKQSHTD